MSVVVEVRFRDDVGVFCFFDGDLLGVPVESFPSSAVSFCLCLELFFLRGVFAAAPVASLFLPFPGELLVFGMVILYFLHRFVEVCYGTVPR